MNDRFQPPDAVAPSAADVLAERVDAAVLEATRDLKAHFAREIDAQFAQMERRLEQRIGDVETHLHGVNVKLVAIRDELHQSLRDQTLKLAVLGMSALALAVAALLAVTRWWR